MRYISTRGRSEELDFSDVLLAGLAPDGGLYMPKKWPFYANETLRGFRGLGYPELVARVMQDFVGPAIDPKALRDCAVRAYEHFSHDAIVPMVQIDRELWVMELFHGPTLAFKDMALQLIGELFEHVLGARGGHVTIVGATSGDTGSAAIEACANRDNIHVVILHPRGRTSEVQRRQMTTSRASNVGNIALDGSFDDCQDMVKALFADAAFRAEMNLSAVNSINFARIAAQIPYYIAASLALGGPEREIAFAVPTGNFGNVLAAWAACRMGVPVAGITIASNRNDILTRFLEHNDMRIAPVAASLSPSMDIQVSSNFERLLFELAGRDSALVRELMATFRGDGHMPVPETLWRAAREEFSARRVTDEETLAEIRSLAAHNCYIADPHSAVGIAAARRNRIAGVPTVAMATAHPAKFPDAMETAIGVRPALPPHLADLFERRERFATAPNDPAVIKNLIRRFRFDNHPPEGTA